MTGDHDAVQVVIVEDGTGVADGPDGRRASSDPGSRNRQGLRNMAERLQEVAGECAWEAATPRGLRVVLRVPRNNASTR